MNMTSLPPLLPHPRPVSDEEPEKPGDSRLTDGASSKADKIQEDISPILPDIPVSEASIPDRTGPNQASITTLDDQNIKYSLVSAALQDSADRITEALIDLIPDIPAEFLVGPLPERASHKTSSQTQPLRPLAEFLETISVNKIPLFTKSAAVQAPDIQNAGHWLHLNREAILPFSMEAPIPFTDNMAKEFLRNLPFWSRHPTLSTGATALAGQAVALAGLLAEIMQASKMMTNFVALQYPPLPTGSGKGGQQDDNETLLALSRLAGQRLHIKKLPIGNGASLAIQKIFMF